MRIIDCVQGSEEWERWRARPTASDFGQFITPARGDYSKSATAYACKIVAKRLGVYQEDPPSYWMEYGTEMEPNAKHAYAKERGVELQEVGFILPDETDAFGGSPDALVGDDGLLEIKCLKPENVIKAHALGEMSNEYKPQVQGLLFISGRAWCDFMVFHPGLTPFVHRVEPDLDYHEKIGACLLTLLTEIADIESKVQRVDHEIVSHPASREELKW